MYERFCLMCGVVDVAPRGGQTMFCLGCGPKANGRNGAAKAWRAVHREVAAGRLPPAQTCSCVDCGAPAKDYDHRDYNKPLDVSPVCRACNKKRGPAIPLGGVGLYTSMQAKFVTPNWDEPARKRKGAPAIAKQEA